MLVTDFLNTVKWLESAFSRETKQVLFEHFLSNMMTRDQRDSLRGGSVGVVMKATTDLAVARTRIVSHKFAPEVLEAFGLDALLREDFPSEVGEQILGLVSGDHLVERAQERGSEVDQTLSLLSRRWNLLIGIYGPLQNLLVPKEIVEEEPFDEILTLELRYEKGVAPRASVISEMLSNIEQLYEAVAKSKGKQDHTPLSLIYVASGSFVRFDLTGLGEPIKEIKHLLVEAWTKIRYRKVDDLHNNNKALLGSLEVLRQIEADANENILDHEDALRLREQVLKNTLALFEAGVLPREIPDEELISNQKLLHNIQVKLLPPHPSEGKESSKKTRTKRRRYSRKKIPTGNSTES